LVEAALVTGVRVLIGSKELQATEAVGALEKTDPLSPPIAEAGSVKGVEMQVRAPLQEA